MILACRDPTHRPKIERLEAEIARLEELLRSTHRPTGAEPYWEGRWRDEYAENQKLRALLREAAPLLEATHCDLMAANIREALADTR